jgi:hypothetical protein
MQAMKDTYARQGLTVSAFNLDTERPEDDKFLRRLQPTFDVRFDPKGELAVIYKVEGMPSSVLIDRHGIPRVSASPVWDFDR